MDEATITTTYNSLLNAMQAHFQAGKRLINAKADLETTKAAAIRDGLITGSNEDLRKASAREVLKDLYAELAAAEAEERETKFRLDYAKVEVDKVRALLDLEEVKAEANRIMEYQESLRRTIAK